MKQTTAEQIKNELERQIGDYGQEEYYQVEKTGENRVTLVTDIDLKGSTLWSLEVAYNIAIATLTAIAGSDRVTDIIDYVTIESKGDIIALAFDTENIEKTLR